jgi:hypothetical protein
MLGITRSVSGFLFLGFLGELTERFRHVKEPGLIHGITDALSEPDAFRGVSMVIDGGKWGHMTLLTRSDKAPRRDFVPQGKSDRLPNARNKEAWLSAPSSACSVSFRFPAFDRNGFPH